MSAAAAAPSHSPDSASHSSTAAAALDAPLPSADAPLSFSLVLHRLQRLAVDSASPEAAASALVVDFSDRLRQWQQSRRAVPVAAVSLESVVEQEREAERVHGRLLERQAADARAALALNEQVARWERQRRQYKQVGERMEAALATALEQQRQWQREAVRVASRPDGGDGEQRPTGAKSDWTARGSGVRHSLCLHSHSLSRVAVPVCVRCVLSLSAPLRRQSVVAAACAVSVRCALSVLCVGCTCFDCSVA